MLPELRRDGVAALACLYRYDLSRHFLTEVDKCEGDMG